MYVYMYVQVTHTSCLSSLETWPSSMDMSWDTLSGSARSHCSWSPPFSLPRPLPPCPSPLPLLLERLELARSYTCTYTYIHTHIRTCTYMLVHFHILQKQTCTYMYMYVATCTYVYRISGKFRPPEIFGL